MLPGALYWSLQNVRSDRGIRYPERKFILHRAYCVAVVKILLT